MGRIITSVTIQNAIEPDKSIRADALVDTGASQMVLPSAWRERLNPLNRIRVVDVETATQVIVKADVCGPVKIQLEGFEPVYSEVLFVEMHPADGVYDPLIGYLVLEQSQAAVDMVEHRLIHVKHLDLK
jgi:predicted aspartyl protease